KRDRARRAELHEVPTVDPFFRANDAHEPSLPAPAARPPSIDRPSVQIGLTARPSPGRTGGGAKPLLYELRSQTSVFELRNGSRRLQLVEFGDFVGRAEADDLAQFVPGLVRLRLIPLRHAPPLREEIG